MAALLPLLERETPHLVLPVVLFNRYLQFLARRPISESNLHFRASRVAGLRALEPMLAAAPQPVIRRVAASVRSLTPTNLVRLAPEIQQALRIYPPPLLPRDVVLMPGAPDPCFLAGVRRILVIIGPAIGLGDEIISFSLPRALHHLVPGVQITVTSSYPQVWDRVAGVDRVEHYPDFQRLLAAIRDPAYDLHVFVDFESPGLLNSMCYEPAVTRYVELALGPRQLAALDRSRNLSWRMPVPEPDYDNYYDCMQHMLHWLGAPRELSCAGLMPSRRTDASALRPAELTMFVNPFTSKEDPSERYWGQLLCSILPASLDTPLQVQINTGPSLSTRGLALALARRMRAHYLGRDLHVEVPHSPGRPGYTLSIGDIFTFADRADIILTADSFPAHAAQLFGRLTCVLGKPRTEPWRAPVPNSFYFDSIDPLPEVAAAIRTLLGDLLGDRSPLVPHAAALHSVAEKLAALLAAPGATPDAAAELFVLLAQAREAQDDFLHAAARASSAYAVLFSDSDYPTLLPAHLATSTLTRNPELWWHRQRRFHEWRNTNLLKYITQPRLQPTYAEPTTR